MYSRDLANKFDMV